jgi:very-short-patch-repair endonuclease
LIWSNARSPQGLVTHDDRLRGDEHRVLAGMQVTTPLRTAFDIGRRGRLSEAVARLDALGNARRFAVDDVAGLATSHRGARGQRQLAEALDLHDAGAESPRETWLRLLLVEAGFPRPRTQIPVKGLDGRPRYRLDMGWEDVMVAAEYDGEHHRKDRPSYIKDIIRSEFIASVGWIVIRVVAGQTRTDILRRVHAARNSRLR